MGEESGNVAKGDSHVQLNKEKVQGRPNSNLSILEGLPQERGYQFILLSTCGQDKKQRVEACQKEVQSGFEEEFSDSETFQAV